MPCRNALSFISFANLVAVVLVFFICQIPQAISLTLSSFFATLAQTSQALIYNNFANILVAINASTNFLLYCCFSERFRSTFQSHFTFLSKYCVHYVQPQWKVNVNPPHHRQGRRSTSIDNLSNHSQPAPLNNTRHSNAGANLHGKHERGNHFSPSTKSTYIQSESSPPIVDQQKIQRVKCHSSQQFFDEKTSFKVDQNILDKTV